MGWRRRYSLHERVVLVHLIDSSRKFQTHCTTRCFGWNGPPAPMSSVQRFKMVYTIINGDIDKNKPSVLDSPSMMSYTHEFEIGRTIDAGWCSAPYILSPNPFSFLLPWRWCSKVLFKNDAWNFENIQHASETTIACRQLLGPANRCNINGPDSKGCNASQNRS